ncbi:hypothetical protein AYI70_g8863 [Smittium culicis]|uniref:Uncharacterized protein n=1 Tax=Smittium culicis TaxID=133412 RepID=A0A1R1XDZ7_9FUNG|nr:hypothetical protein AYI70_g10856 [Smittium culicis]OMJ12847.1 hypothetical protein AYI70_g8863 [Smittium culicis]
MDYDSPVVNIKLSSTSRRSETAMYDAQYRLSTINRPIDFFVRERIQDGKQVPVSKVIEFANSIREYSRTSSHRFKIDIRSKYRGGLDSLLIRIIFGLEAAPDPESRGQTGALSQDIEDANRSTLGKTGHQGIVKNSFQYAPSHSQAAKAVRKGFKEISGKGRREVYLLQEFYPIKL